MGIRKRAGRRPLSDDAFSVGGDFALLHGPALAGRDCRALALDPPAAAAPLRTLSFSCFRREGAPWPEARRAACSVAPTAAGLELSNFWIPRGALLLPMEGQDCNSGSPSTRAAGSAACCTRCSPAPA